MSYVGMDPNSPGGSVQAAQGYADQAQATLQTLLGICYGVAASDPATDPNGNAPGDGDWYFNSTTNSVRFRSAGVWRDAPGSPTLGKQTIWVPSGAMTPRTTNGAAYGGFESTTNKIMHRTLDFDPSTAKYAQFQVRMPKSWDKGNLTAYFLWSRGAATGSFDAIWGIQAIAMSDGDSLDAAFGSVVTVTDTASAQDTLYQSAETAIFSPSGSIGDGDLVSFQVYRDAANASDNLNANARLHGVALIYTMASFNDA